MIKLSDERSFEYMVASGALAFDGRGWWWERVLVWLGLIQPDRFVVVLKTLTRKPLYGNLHWRKPWTWLPFSPWSCVRFLPGGVVNKVGLTNPGFDWWLDKVAPTIDFRHRHIVVSIFGDTNELIYMASKLNMYNLVAIEVNPSCPNTGHGMPNLEEIVHRVKGIKAISRHPIIVKVSVEQDYVGIAQKLEGVVQAMSLNSVPWKMVFPDGDINPPLRKLGDRTDKTYGGVSGKPAQKLNWEAVEKIARFTDVPVIGPSVMEYEDIAKLRSLGAHAISFGAIHVRTPWRPTAFVLKDQQESLGRLGKI